MKFSSASLFSVCAFSALTLTGNSVQAGSLWLKEGSTEQSMFADKIARNIGDILTIVVSEDTSTQQTARIKTYENTQGGTGIFPALNATLNGFVQALPSWLSKSSGGAVDQNDVTIPTLDIAAKSEWNGGGDTQNTLTLTNRTAVTVVDVAPTVSLPSFSAPPEMSRSRDASANTTVLLVVPTGMVTVPPSASVRMT